MLSCKSNFQVVSYAPITKEEYDKFGNKVILYETIIEQGTGSVYYVVDIYYEDPAYGPQLKTAKVLECDIEEYLKKKIVPWYYVQEQRGRANNSTSLVRHKLKKKDFVSVLCLATFSL